MEVKPTITIDPTTGEESISYDHAVVIDHSYIDEAQRQHREQEQNYAYYEQEGEIHSKWADAIDTADAQVQEELQQQYQVEEPDDESGFSHVDEIAEYIFTEQGEEYRAMINWAYENVDSEFIEKYDAIIDSGNVDQIVKAINTLTEFYNKHH